MKKLLVLLSTFFVFNLSFSQTKEVTEFVTPGNGQTYNLTELVNVSNGVVTLENDTYFLNGEITISETDQLEILENATMICANSSKITLFGKLDINPSNKFTMTIADTTDPDLKFIGIQLKEGADNSRIKNTTINYGCGIKVASCNNIVIEDCNFYKNYYHKSNGSGVIVCSNCSIEIKNSNFYYAERAAITSPANGSVTATVDGCNLVKNVTSNKNYPQINFGPGNYIITNNYVEGEQPKSGGIAVSALISGNITATIANNHVYNNRYGIAGIGNNIEMIVTDNTIIDNNLEVNPMNGGSGINMYATSETSKIYASRNYITGSLWGVTIVGNAVANFGNLTEGEDYNEGKNIIFDNFNGGVEYNFYNNTPNDIYAQNNYWGYETLEESEEVVIDNSDIDSLGVVYIDPIYVYNDCSPIENLEANVFGYDVTLTWDEPSKLNKFTFDNLKVIKQKKSNLSLDSAKVVLVANDVWWDGTTGYQMLLDFDHNTYGNVIPATGELFFAGSEDDNFYSDNFEYTIPENAEPSVYSSTFIVDGSGEVTLPSGTYDWCIVYPYDDNMLITSDNGPHPGRADDFVFEGGYQYTFTMDIYDISDGVDLDITEIHNYSYNIYRDNEKIATTSELFFKDESVEVGLHNYCVEVNCDESSVSEEVCIDVNIEFLCNPVTNLNSEINENNITLNWELNLDEPNYFEEGFEAGYLPEGWEIRQFDANTWEVGGLVNYSYNNIYPHSGDYQIYCFFSYDPQDEWLITPYITIPNNANLSFWTHVLLGSSYNDHYYVKISTDNGETWTKLWDASEQQSGYNQYETPIEIDLTPYGGKQVLIAWHALSDDGIYHTWFLDDIFIVSSEKKLQFNGKDIIDLTRDDITFNIYQNNELVGSTTEYSFTHENVENGDYEYCVEVEYNECISEKTCLDVTLNYNPCYAVNNFKAVNVDNSNIIKLTWDYPNNVSSLIGYKIYLFDDEIAFIQDGSVTEFIDDFSYVNKDEEATYCIKAIYESCESDPECAQVDIITNIIDNNLNIFPNPAENIVYIKGLSVKELYVYNNIGELVEKVNDNIIDVSNYASGLYIINIITTDDKKITSKIIVK